MTERPSPIGVQSQRFAVLPVASVADCDIVARLAKEIWFEHYVPIIGLDQVIYMVERFQSVPAIESQIARGFEYFLLMQAGAARGYFAIQPQPAERSMFLSKFYLEQSCRGQGLGRHGLGFIEARCRKMHLPLLWLTVNRFNPAVHAYERLGFVRVGEVVADIGNGFVMDDYRMEKRVDRTAGEER